MIRLFNTLFNVNIAHGWDCCNRGDWKGVYSEGTICGIRWEAHYRIISLSAFLPCCVHGCKFAKHT